MIGPEEVVTYRCNKCQYLTCYYDSCEGWFDCYCKDIFIGCFGPAEDIWPTSHYDGIKYECPELKEVIGDS
jgi:hypothetical protein